MLILTIELLTAPNKQYIMLFAQHIYLDLTKPCGCNGKLCCTTETYCKMKITVDNKITFFPL